MFGDPNQCEPVESGSRLHCDYLLSQTCNEMCPKRVTLEYIEGCSRYDKKTHEMLETFLKHGKVSTQFEATADYYKNICFLNKTRKEINEKCCKKFCEDKNYINMNFKYNGEKETYQICEGMPVSATQNIKDKEVFNTMEFKIEKIKNDKIFINNTEFSREEFAESFIPNFCATVYKYQGSDIKEDYNIFDTHMMDKKQMYTALSRTTKFEYLHINNSEIRNKYFIRKQPDVEIINPRIISLFNSSKIYLIKHKNGKMTISSSHENGEVFHLLQKKYPISNVITLAYVPCVSKQALLKIHCAYIEEYKFLYGSQITNRTFTKHEKKEAKKIEYKAEMGNEDKLRDRIAELNEQIKIEDNENKKFFYFDTKIDGKRHPGKARYNKSSKEKAFKRINEKKDKLINDITHYFQ